MTKYHHFPLLFMSADTLSDTVFNLNRTQQSHVTLNEMEHFQQLCVVDTETCERHMTLIAPWETPTP